MVGDASVVSEEKLIIEHTSTIKMPVMAYYLDLVREGAVAGYGLHYREFGVSRQSMLPVSSLGPLRATFLSRAFVRCLGSTLKPPKRSVSPSRPHSSPAPTR